MQKKGFSYRSSNIDQSFISKHHAGPDSANGRASASGAGGRGFDPGPRHTKGIKNFFFFFFFFFFLIQFNVPFKIISLIETGQSV